MSTLTKLPTTVSETGSDVAWSNLDNIKIDDANKAQVTLTNFNSISNSLIAKFDFSSIPPESLISAIDLKVEWDSDGISATGKDTIVRWYSDDLTPVGDNKASDAAIATSLTEVDFTGDWGFTPTPQQIQDSDYQAQLRFQRLTGTVDILINYAQVDVTYETGREYNPMGAELKGLFRSSLEL